MDMEIITEGMSEEEKQFLDKILNFKVNNVSGYDICSYRTYEEWKRGS